MKRFHTGGKINLFLLCLALIACDRFPSNPDLGDPHDALYVLVEAHALKQLWLYHYFETFSNAYEDGQLFVYEPTKPELESLYEELNAVLQYKDNVIIAAQTLTDSLGLTPSPLSKTSGIFGSLFSFFSEGDGVGERHRDRILLVVSNMSPEERSNLFNNQLRSKWQQEFSDADDFWAKLQNGDLDDRTGGIYNDFYDNSDLNNRFVSLANDRKLSPSNIFVKEGASLVEKGVDVVLETSKIVTPLGGGADIVEEGNKWWEKAEKAVDDPRGLIKDEIKERVAGKLAGMVDIDGAVNAVGLGEKTASGLKILADISVGTDDTQELYEKAIDWGVAKITSPDKSIAPEVIVAENKSDGISFPDLIFGVGNYVNTAGETLMSLPAGNWDITVVDKKANQNKEPAVKISAGQETAVICEENDDSSDSLDVVLQSLNAVYVIINNGGSIWGIENRAPYDSLYALKWIGKSFSSDFSVYYDQTGYQYTIKVEGLVSLQSYDNIELTVSADYLYENFGMGYRSHERIVNINATAIPLAYSRKDSYGNPWLYFIINPQYYSNLLPSLAEYANYNYSSLSWNSDGSIWTSDSSNTIVDPLKGYIEIRLGQSDYKVINDY